MLNAKTFLRQKNHLMSDIFIKAMFQKNVPNCGACPFMYAHCFDYTVYGSEDCLENFKRQAEKMDSYLRFLESQSKKDKGEENQCTTRTQS